MKPLQPKASDLTPIPLDTVKPEPLKWLWHGWILAEKITLISGDPGLGKSLVTLDIASRISTGEAFPLEPSGKRREPGNVMLLVAEEGIADTVVPRLDMAGADRSRIFAFKAEHVANKQNFNWLREQLKKSTDTRLVVIDPLTGFLGATDPNANHEVRMRMQDLAAIAEECSVAILCLLHHSKALHSRAVHRVAGATSFTGVARMALAVCKDDADPDRRLLMPVKNNHGKGGVALPFRVIAPETDMPKVEWEEKLVRVNADEALTHDLARTRNRQIGEADRALAFLRETLANGPMAQTDVMKLAKERQISERTIDRVKHRALVLSKKLASGWVWSIEPKSEPTEDGGTVGTVGILGTVGTLPTPDLPPFPVPVSMRVGG